MVTRVNICLPQDILEQIDREAMESGSSRSALLVQAARVYIEQRRDARAREKRKKAAETIRAVAEQLGDWDAVGELLKSRDSH